MCWRRRGVDWIGVLEGGGVDRIGVLEGEWCRLDWCVGGGGV